MPEWEALQALLPKSALRVRCQYLSVEQRPVRKPGRHQHVEVLPERQQRARNRVAERAELSQHVLEVPRLPAHVPCLLLRVVPRRQVQVVEEHDELPVLPQEDARHHVHQPVGALQGPVHGRVSLRVAERPARRVRVAVHVGVRVAVILPLLVP